MTSELFRFSFLLVVVWVMVFLVFFFFYFFFHFYQTTALALRQSIYKQTLLVSKNENHYLIRQNHEIRNTSRINIWKKPVWKFLYWTSVMTSELSTLMLGIFWLPFIHSCARQISMKWILWSLQAFAKHLGSDLAFVLKLSPSILKVSSNGGAFAIWSKTTVKITMNYSLDFLSIFLEINKPWNQSPKQKTSPWFFAHGNTVYT